MGSYRIKVDDRFRQALQLIIDSCGGFRRGGICRAATLIGVSRRSIDGWRSNRQISTRQSRRQVIVFAAIIRAGVSPLELLNMAGARMWTSHSERDRENERAWRRSVLKRFGGHRPPVEIMKMLRAARDFKRARREGPSSAAKPGPSPSPLTAERVKRIESALAASGRVALALNAAADKAATRAQAIIDAADGLHAAIAAAGYQSPAGRALEAS